MAINVLTETPEAIGKALAGADAETIARIVTIHRDAMREAAQAVEAAVANSYAPPCEHPDAYVSPTHGRLHDWQVYGDGAAKRFKCARCGYAR